ncbi:transforming acidic coiled-coil-containing protein 3 isoform X2 [Planococcus citri]|uniref:transforming acidic coiled-coil-containing protein 3 isoform X2 n=1 Tax=Planococcus citri TaxID=170843 RepID=UPI0031F90C6F
MNTKSEGEDVEVEEKNIYLTGLATESENLSSSAISEDAISLTTDSTATTTEYESANENDNCSNRVSTSTDIWYDFSSSVKSVVNEADLSAESSLSEPKHQFNHEHATKRIMNCSKENISEAGPATAADIDNINNVNVPFLNDSSELDFISKAGGTGLVAETLRKQSLYVKFDPLVSQEVNSSINDNTLKFDDSSIANNTLTAAVNNLNLDTSQENHTSAEVTTESLKLNESSVGKLISVTPVKSPRKNTPKSSPRYADIDPDDVSKLQSLLLKQMKREEAFKEEIDSLKLENEQVLKKLQNSEQEISNLKSVLEAVQENEKKLKNELMERIKSKQQLSLIMEEYEKTMSQMVSKRDEEKKEHDAIIKKIEAERDSTLQHLNNLENAFNDIHQKYERGKAVNEALKKNEDLLKKNLSDYEQTVKTVENKYELLKSHATSQLEKANQELELITQSYEKEQAKMKAMLKKSEIQISSLQNALERKSKENQELTAICDELIVKLSTHSNS